MVWAGFCSHGKTPICFMKGKQDSKCYQKLLSDNLLPLWTQGDKLLHDNAPIHVSESTIKFLNDNGIDKLEWPSRFPDLNPMENLGGCTDTNC